MFGSFGARTEQLRICEEISAAAHARRPIEYLQPARPDCLMIATRKRDREKLQHPRHYRDSHDGSVIHNPEEEAAEEPGHAEDGIQHAARSWHGDRQTSRYPRGSCP
jgi:hypothetical protein